MQSDVVGTTCYCWMSKWQILITEVVDSFTHCYWTYPYTTTITVSTLKKLGQNWRAYSILFSISVSFQYGICFSENLYNHALNDNWLTLRRTSRVQSTYSSIRYEPFLAGLLLYLLQPPQNKCNSITTTLVSDEDKVLRCACACVVAYALQFTIRFY